MKKKIKNDKFKQCFTVFQNRIILMNKYSVEYHV